MNCPNCDKPIDLLEAVRCPDCDNIYHFNCFNDDINSGCCIDCEVNLTGHDS